MKIAVPPLVRRILTEYGLVGYFAIPYRCNGRTRHIPTDFRVQAVSSGMYSPRLTSALCTTQSFSLQVTDGLLVPFFAITIINCQRCHYRQNPAVCQPLTRPSLNFSAAQSSSSAPDSMTSDTWAPPVSRASSSLRFVRSSWHTCV